MSTLSSTKSDYNIFCVSKGYLFYTWGWLREYNLDSSEFNISNVIINGPFKTSRISFDLAEVRAAVTDQYTCDQLMQTCQRAYGPDYNYIYSTPIDTTFYYWCSLVDMEGNQCPHSIRQLTKFEFGEGFL